MITLKVITRSGEPAELQVEELVAIDNEPFRQAEDTSFLTAQISELKGRISTIERALFPPLEQEDTTNG